MNDGTLIEEVLLVVVVGPLLSDAGGTANDVGLRSLGIAMEAMPLSSDSWLSRRRWLSCIGIRGTFGLP